MLKSILIFSTVLFFFPLIAQNQSANITKNSAGNTPENRSYFATLANGDKITLRWHFDDEKQIVGYKVFRSEAESRDYILISSFESNPALNNQSLLANKSHYIFQDLAVVPGTIYWYKIICVGKNHNTIEHGPASASLPTQQIFKDMVASPKAFRLEPIHKNALKSLTTLQLDIPYEVESNHPAQISIYGPRGERIKTIYKGLMEAGSYQLVWNGDTEKGNMIREGVFFAVFENDRIKEATKLILIK